MSYIATVIWDESIDNLEDWIDDDGNPMDIDDIYELNASYLDDVRYAYNKKLENPIVILADLDFWNGPQKSIAIVGNNLVDCFKPAMKCQSINKFYIDRYNLCHEEAHHDGTNHYIYRQLKGNDPEVLRKLVKNGEWDKSAITRYTKSLKPLILKLMYD